MSEIIRKVFDLTPEQVQIKKALASDFIEIEIYAISNADPNRNMSCFLLESMEKGKYTFVNKPILGFFNKDNDFEAHNGQVGYDKELKQEYWDNAEQILGFIRESDEIEIVDREDGLKWIRCTAMIYTKYNFRQVKKLLKDKHKKVSVEVEIKKFERINDIDYIYEFELTGITILGSRKGIPVKEGIEGASLSVIDLMRTERYNQQVKSLTFAYNNLEEKNTKKEEDSQVEDLKTNSQATAAVFEDNKTEEHCEECQKKEEKMAEIQKECDDLKMKLQECKEEYEQAKKDYEQISSELESYKARCEEQTQSIKGYVEELGKYSDYNETKEALAKATEKLEEVKRKDQMSYIDSLKNSAKFSSDELASIIQNCQDGKYASNEEIDKEAGLILLKRFQQQANSQAGYVVNINPEENAAPQKQNLSLKDRLKNNLK